MPIRNAAVDILLTSEHSLTADIERAEDALERASNAERVARAAHENAVNDVKEKHKVLEHLRKQRVQVIEGRQSLQKRLEAGPTEIGDLVG